MLGSAQPGAEAARPPGGERTYRLARCICPRDEFNALRDGLPRSVRREVDLAPPGHLGLLLQAITGADYPLLTVYGHVHADVDPADAFAALEQRLRKRLG
jgi:hypothetical protein